MVRHKTVVIDLARRARVPARVRALPISTTGLDCLLRCVNSTLSTRGSSIRGILRSMLRFGAAFASRSATANVVRVTASHKYVDFMHELGMFVTNKKIAQKAHLFDCLALTICEHWCRQTLTRHKQLLDTRHARGVHVKHEPDSKNGRGAASSQEDDNIISLVDDEDEEDEDSVHPPSSSLIRICRSRLVAPPLPRRARRSSSRLSESSSSSTVGEEEEDGAADDYSIAEPPLPASSPLSPARSPRYTRLALVSCDDDDDRVPTPDVPSLREKKQYLEDIFNFCLLQKDARTAAGYSSQEEQDGFADRISEAIGLFTEADVVDLVTLAAAEQCDRLVFALACCIWDDSGEDWEGPLVVALETAIKDLGPCPALENAVLEAIGTRK